MKDYLPENTQRNRVFGYRVMDWVILVLVVGSVGLWFVRNEGVPSQKELLVIDRQVEILKLQQAQQAFEYNLGVQQQEQEVFQSSIDILGESAAIQLDMQEAITRGLVLEIIEQEVSK